MVAMHDGLLRVLEDLLSELCEAFRLRAATALQVCQDLLGLTIRKTICVIMDVSTEQKLPLL